tara:strand:+ start:834 stop:1649 length:816 start_codon:yes stop_codon:yes gene_type:complete
MEIQEAQAFRYEYRRDEEHNKRYSILLKQPIIIISYKKETLTIIDRRVLWDLIRNFDPEIDYRTFLEMLDYFSVYKIVEDYLLDYNDRTLGVWVQKSNSKESVIVGVQHTTEIQDLAHEEIVRYFKGKIRVDSWESFIKIGKSVKVSAGTTPRKHRSSVLRIIHDDMFVEITDKLTKKGRHKPNKVEIRLFKEVDDGLVQMRPLKRFVRNLTNLQRDILYANLDAVITDMTSEYRRITSNVRYKKRGKMTDQEWDKIQHLWFLNSFRKVEG